MTLMFTIVGGAVFDTWTANLLYGGAALITIVAIVALYMIINMVNQSRMVRSKNKKVVKDSKKRVQQNLLVLVGIILVPLLIFIIRGRIEHNRNENQFYKECIASYTWDPNAVHDCSVQVGRDK